MGGGGDNLYMWNLYEENYLDLMKIIIILILHVLYLYLSLFFVRKDLPISFDSK